MTILASYFHRPIVIGAHTERVSPQVTLEIYSDTWRLVVTGSASASQTACLWGAARADGGGRRDTDAQLSLVLTSVERQGG